MLKLHAVIIALPFHEKEKRERTLKSGRKKKILWKKVKYNTCAFKIIRLFRDWFLISDLGYFPENFGFWIDFYYVFGWLIPFVVNYTNI